MFVAAGSDGSGKRRLAFLDMLLELVRKGEMEFNDVRPEVDTFMMEVCSSFLTKWFLRDTTQHRPVWRGWFICLVIIRNVRRRFVVCLLFLTQSRCIVNWTKCLATVIVMQASMIWISWNIWKHALRKHCAFSHRYQCMPVKLFKMLQFVSVTLFLFCFFVCFWKFENLFDSCIL